jgi:hypothetical protein
MDRMTTTTTPDKSALIEALRAAAAGEFRPWFYRVKISPRKRKRYRMPGIALRVTPKEALAMLAFRRYRRLQHFGDRPIVPPQAGHGAEGADKLCSARIYK